MAPPRDPTKKNKRKRKRKPVEFSSSSSSSSSSEDEQPTKVPTPPVTQSSSSSSSSSSDSDSDSDSGPPPRRELGTQTQTQSEVTPTSANVTSGMPDLPVASRTPSPEPTAFPSFLPPKPSEADNEERENKERQMKERFRQFWMATVADEFKADLEEIRKEPGLTQSRLAMLIEGLASSANAFSSTSKDGGVNEMELVVEAADLSTHNSGAPSASKA
ncbi:hypothetical protein FRC04_000054 [Tulasnella sp. 424]|nr:hypothetical protein FRC04_000054 [Tulasnella sp. 424]KAG8981916.1 hypothetical protein FRC05_000058 [Tulasnella sp. 425]